MIDCVVRVARAGSVALALVLGGASAFAESTEAPTDLITVDSRFLSSETVGGSAGVYAGLYATGNGKPVVAPADFDWFEYAKR